MKSYTEGYKMKTGYVGSIPSYYLSEIYILIIYKQITLLRKYVRLTNIFTTEALYYSMRRR